MSEPEQKSEDGEYGSSLTCRADILTSSEHVRDLARTMGGMIESALPVITVRDPEHRARLDYRILPSVDPNVNPHLSRQLEIMLRSSLIKDADLAAIEQFSTTIRRAAAFGNRRNWTRTPDLTKNHLMKTLGKPKKEGAIYFIFHVFSSAPKLSEALNLLPKDLWLSPISCYVKYESPSSWRDTWILGTVSCGSAELANAELGVMVDRQKITTDASSAVGDWLDILADSTAAFSPIRE